MGSQRALVSSWLQLVPRGKPELRLSSDHEVNERIDAGLAGLALCTNALVIEMTVIVMKLMEGKQSRSLSQLSQLSTARRTHESVGK